MRGREFFAKAEMELKGMRPAAAIRAFERAERSGCDADLCSAGRWTCHMLLGQFESAWQESDRIAARGRPDPNRFWDGLPVDGRSVLVRCLHGLGDTLQFVRYAPLIRPRARRLIIQAQPPLKALLEEAQIADEVITWDEPEPYWNQQIEIVELPRLFRTTLASVPDSVPYLDIPAMPVSRESDGPIALRVGLVWASGSYNSARSIPLKGLAALLAIPGVRFYSLQAEPERFELQTEKMDVCDIYDQASCALDAAKTLKSIDLLISADTMMAHLAGALACPVWTLLPFECDWRWMLGRADSPWYPTMRLFRQPQPGDWASVIASVGKELQKATSAHEVIRAT
ncbi:MAG TPA: hypothetical protein VLI55_07760 [Bryobacteraceae bacterium]|nr:hypothetical protein [Bryobacteraceae bacterium]